MLSFAIYFHSSRIENLKQMLRFIFSREKIKKEVVLVCNDATEQEFPGCRVINLNLSNYHKAKMCNIAVEQSSNEIVALMDSDRIMPENYFSSVATSLSRGEFVSCPRILKLVRHYSDIEIQENNFEFEEDYRSDGWEIRRKNLFSGNTVFYKKDYFTAGGMDESFLGYGFCDNDMTANIFSKGFLARWERQDELHLYHEKEVMENGKMVGSDDFRKTSEKNLHKFVRKWKPKEYWSHFRYIQ